MALVEVTPESAPEISASVEAPPSARRTGNKGRLRAGIAGRERVKTQIAMMTAAACSTAEISRGLKLSRDRVSAILGQADTQGLVEDFRKLVRAHALSESLDIAVKGMRWVNEAIDNREAKEFDLVTRGLSNMEKVWSSASGENKPAGVQVAVINQSSGETSAEIAKLVELLVGPSAP